MSAGVGGDSAPIGGVAPNGGGGGDAPGATAGNAVVVLLDAPCALPGAAASLMECAGVDADTVTILIDASLITVDVEHDDPDTLGPFVMGFGFANGQTVSVVLVNACAIEPPTGEQRIGVAIDGATAGIRLNEAGAAVNLRWTTSTLRPGGEWNVVGTFRAPFPQLQDVGLFVDQIARSAAEVASWQVGVLSPQVATVATDVATETTDRYAAIAAEVAARNAAIAAAIAAVSTAAWRTAADIDFTAEGTGDLAEGTVALGARVFHVFPHGGSLLDTLTGTGLRMTPGQPMSLDSDCPLVCLDLPDAHADLAEGAPWRRLRLWFLVETTSDYVGNKALVVGLQTRYTAAPWFDATKQDAWAVQYGRDQWQDIGHINFASVAVREGVPGADTVAIENASAPDVIVLDWRGPDDCHTYSGSSVSDNFPAFDALTPRSVVGIRPAGPFAVPSRLVDQVLSAYVKATNANGAGGGTTFIATLKRLRVEYL